MILRYKSSIYYKFEILEKELRIFYIDYDERDCMSYIDIPFEYIYKGSFEPYIEKLYKAWKQKDDELRLEIEKRKEAHERDLYEKLKLKYDNIDKANI